MPNLVVFVVVVVVVFAWLLTGSYSRKGGTSSF